MIKKKILKDFFFRVKYSLNEAKNSCEKHFIKSYFLKSEIRIQTKFKLAKNFLKKQLGTSYINNRCLITNRAKIINKKLKISRMEFKRLVSVGFIKGYKRAS